MSERDDGLYLTDMRQAIEKIERYIGDTTFKDFVNDDKTYDAVMRELTVLGEAASRVSKDFKESHPEVPWREITSMRNRLMHEYSNIENDVVWDTYQNDIPKLKQTLQNLG